jgi:molybdate transport repressor ModE-like protein
MRFDLVDLRLFLHVAEAGSITAGAERSGLALASASARIKGMEEMLGVALVERQRRGVILTSAGQTLLFHARTIQNQIETMAGDLGEHARGLRAHVRLLANTAAASLFLPDILAQFLAANPNIDVELDEHPSHVIVEKLANGQADLGIAASWADLTRLEQKPFHADQLAAISARGAFLPAGVRSVRFEDILGEAFVGLGSGNALQEHVIRQASHSGQHINFRVRVATFEAACQLVAKGAGIAIVPQLAAQRSAVSRRIRILPLSNEWATRHLKICAKSFSDLTPQARLLAEALDKAAGMHATG